jgi:hypothetical protein
MSSNESDESDSSLAPSKVTHDNKPSPPDREKRPWLEKKIDVNGSDLGVMEDQVEKAQRAGEVARLVRETKSADRLEWLKFTQQIFVLGFMIATFLIWVTLATWSAYQLMSHVNNANHETAKTILNTLLESGLAAIVAFFMIKRFEK